MKLIDSLLLSSIAAFLIIALYQTVVFGILYSYWLFMVVAGCVLWLNMRKSALPAPLEKQEAKGKKKKK